MKHLFEDGTLKREELVLRLDELFKWKSKRRRCAYIPGQLVITILAMCILVPYAFLFRPPVKNTFQSFTT